MKYDPIKEIIGNAVRDNVLLRRLLYTMLGLMFLREWHVKRAIRSLMQTSPTPQRIYDAGSGFGQYSYYCATRYPTATIHAVDIKGDQIEDCRRFFAKARIPNVEFAVEDLAEIIHQDYFDVALSVDVMEHIPDDAAVFRNLHRALKPGGRMLVNTPSTLGGSDVDSPDDESFIEEHARAGYGVEEIRAKLEAAGFIVERIKFTYGIWGSIAWRLGIKYPMILLNTSKLFFLLLPLYYFVTLPFTLILMYLDYVRENRTGTGLLVIARKP